MRFCTHCGADVVEKEWFCTRCGTAFGAAADPPEGAPECTGCGRSLSPAWRHCGHCGTTTAHAAPWQPPRPDDGDELTGPTREVLIPEVVGESDVELISRSAQAAVPQDAPLPPSGTGTSSPAPPPAPQLPREPVAVPDASAEPAAPPEPEPTAPAGRRPREDDADLSPTEDAELPPIEMEREEPPISIFSQDRLQSGRFDRIDPSLIPAPRGDVAPGSLAARDDHAASLPAVVEHRLPAPIEARSSGDAPEPALFRDPGPSAALARFGLVAVAGIATWTAFALMLLNTRIAEVADATGTVGAVSDAQALVNTRLRPALIAIGALTVLALIRWTHRSYRNVPSFGKTDLRFRPATVALAWFVPGLNLIVPPLAMNDAWRASDVYARDDTRWRRRRGNRWTWLAFAALTVAVGGAALSLFPGRDTFQGAIDANRLLIGAAAALVVGTLAMARAVATITRRQRGRLAPVRAGRDR